MVKMKQIPDFYTKDVVPIHQLEKNGVRQLSFFGLWEGAEIAL